MDLDSVSYRELQVECKRLGLNARGKRKDLVERLKSSTSHDQNSLTLRSQEDTKFQSSHVDPSENHDEEEIRELAISSLIVKRSWRWDPEGEISAPLVDRRRDPRPRDLLTLREEADKAMTILAKNIESRHKVLAEMQLRLKSLDESVGRMTASLGTYHHARNRFLSAFKKDKLGRATGEDLRIIAEGGFIAEGGDAATDAMLYAGPTGRRDFTTFQKLYGLQPETVRKIKRMETLTILSTHAGVLSSHKKTGSPRFYSLFNDFIQLFTVSGIGCDEGYLDGNRTEVTNAYWAFVKCTDTEVTWVAW